MKPLAMLRPVGHIMSPANGAGVSRGAGGLSVVVIIHDASGHGLRVRVIQLNGGNQSRVPG